MIRSKSLLNAQLYLFSGRKFIRKAIPIIQYLVGNGIGVIHGKAFEYWHPGNLICIYFSIFKYQILLEIVLRHRDIISTHQSLLERIVRSWQEFIGNRLQFGDESIQCNMLDIILQQQTILESSDALNAITFYLQ
jgi:hypothetical protein